MTYTKAVKVWRQGAGRWITVYINARAKLCIWHGQHGVGFDKCAVCQGDYKVG